MALLKKIFILIIALFISYGLLELHYYIALSQLNINELIKNTNVFNNFYLNACFIGLLYIVIYGCIHFIINRFLNNKYNKFYSIIFAIIVASIHLLIMRSHGIFYNSASYLSYISLHILASLFINLSFNYKKSSNVF